MDRGEGGKYLILPPGYKGQTPEGLHRAAGVGNVRLALRYCVQISKPPTTTNIAKAVAYGKRVRFYPIAQAANPPDTKFVDALDFVFDSTIPYNMLFFRFSTNSYSASHGRRATR